MGASQYSRASERNPSLGLGVALAVRLRTTQCKKQNVEIADDRQEKCVMDSNAVGDGSLCNWNDRSADDSHDHDSGAVSRERPKLSTAECKDAGEHDGIKKSHQNDAVHGEVPGRQHGDRYKPRGADRANAK